MVNILILGALFIFSGVCFTLGMYIATEISNWIKKLGKSDKL
tara:strand:- start:279 stop:404 length:126 start_codon:yes stop_codon:yes gene_type:complete